MSIPSKIQQNKSKLAETQGKKNQKTVRRAEPFANALFSVALETLADVNLDSVLNVSGLISNTSKLPSQIEFFDIYQDIKSVHTAFSTEIEINEFFKNPRISVETKKEYFSKFFPNVDQKIRNLIFLLIDNNKIDLILEVLEQVLHKYWIYLQIYQYDLTLGKFGSQIEANFVSYQFSSLLNDLKSEKSATQKKINIFPKRQIKNIYSPHSSIIGGFSLGFSQGTGFLNFTVNNEFNKFFGRIDKRSSD